MNREIKFRAWDKKGKFMEIVDDLQMFNNNLNVGLPSNEYFLGEDDVELMQYTGLDDKNGKEIYEGDIVKYENMTGKIMFLNGSFIMSNFEETEEWELGVINAEIEVIGNEYDNPELLGGEEQCI